MVPSKEEQVPRRCRQSSKSAPAIQKCIIDLPLCLTQRQIVEAAGAGLELKSQVRPPDSAPIPAPAAKQSCGAVARAIECECSRDWRYAVHTAAPVLRRSAHATAS